MSLLLLALVVQTGLMSGYHSSKFVALLLLPAGQSLLDAEPVLPLVIGVVDGTSAETAESVVVAVC